MKSILRILASAALVFAVLSAFTPSASASVSTNTSIADIRASAQDNSAPPFKSDFSIWRTVGSLLIVLGLLFAVTKILKGRLGSPLGGGTERRLRITERLALGQKQYLMVVVVDEKEILLAVTPDRVTSLADLGTAKPSRLKEVHS